MSSLLVQVLANVPVDILCSGKCPSWHIWRHLPVFWDGCQNCQNKFQLWRHLPEWISVVWDSCQNCQNEFELLTHLPECISSAEDSCKNIIEYFVPQDNSQKSIFEQEDYSQICQFYHWDSCQNHLCQKLIWLRSILAKAIAPCRSSMNEAQPLQNEKSIWIYMNTVVIYFN